MGWDRSCSVPSAWRLPRAQQRAPGSLLSWTFLFCALLLWPPGAFPQPRILAISALSSLRLGIASLGGGTRSVPAAWHVPSYRTQLLLPASSSSALYLLSHRPRLPWRRHGRCWCMNPSTTWHACTHAHARTHARARTYTRTHMRRLCVCARPSHMLLACLRLRSSHTCIPTWVNAVAPTCAVAYA
jgi:hypothetical protein